MTEELRISTLDGFSWEMKHYTQGVMFQSVSPALTQHIAEHVFQLDPPPPELEETNTANAYILEAQKQRNLDYFSFFLHKTEPYLNRIIHQTLVGDGDIRYDPEQFMDIKLSCMQTMLLSLPHYDLSKGASFLTYVYHNVKNTIRQFQMTKESWSFSSLSHYKKIRTAAWMQKNLPDPVESFAAKYKCDIVITKKNLAEAKAIHDREESRDETEAIVMYDYAEILWNGVNAKAVRKAFDQLPAEEQYYLEARNAICMRCGKVAPLGERLTFEELGEKFEFTTANGAEKAYHRAVEHLALLMADDNAIRVVTIKQKSATRNKKKIAAAIFEYQADGDGEWGVIHFDFECSKAEILALAELDTTRSHIYAQKAIDVIFEDYKEKLPKKKMIAFPR